MICKWGEEMSLPACQHCHSKWTWREVFFKTLRRKMKCNYCGAVQYVDSKSMKRVSFISVLPVFIWLPLFLLRTSLVWNIVVLFVILTVVMMFIPYQVRLSNKEEPLW